MEKAVSAVSSMKGSLMMKAGPVEESGTFSQTMSGGTVSALDMKLTVDSSGNKIDMNIRSVGSTSYLGPAATLQALGVDTHGKPWVELSGSSSNPVLSQLAASIGQAKGTTGPQQYAAMVAAASGLRKLGTGTVNGVTATHYKLTVDVARMAAIEGADSSAAAAAKQSGLKDIPLDVWLDAQNRPVQVQEKFSVQGQHIDVLVKMGDYNKPLKISAPAPKDVAKG